MNGQITLKAVFVKRELRGKSVWFSRRIQAAIAAATGTRTPPLRENDPKATPLSIDWSLS